MKNLISSLRLLLFMTVLVGFVYPFAITSLAQIFFKAQAGGSLIAKDGNTVGSKLIAQKFSKPGYFWSRPSAVDFNPLPSGGSNLGQANATLKTQVEERRTALKSANPRQGDQPVPQDLLFASGSGLDPHISPEAADYQVARVAQARLLNAQQVKSLVEAATEKRQFGFLGEPRVNVLKLNLALDSLAQGGP
ncbi:MAG: potassium-transporting ATPase subunit KdpC [Bdellovibrionales bacterium]